MTQPQKNKRIEIQTTAADHRIAKLAAFAIGLHLLEAVIPSPLPGVKPGLANIVTLFVLYRFDFATAAWVSLLRVPNHIFLPIILMMASIGRYSVRNSMLDVGMLLVVALIGYILRKLEFQLAPMVVGLVLGPLIEKHMREGLFMSLGEVSVFYTSPIAIVIWILVIAVLLLEPLRQLAARMFGIKIKKIIPESSE